MVGETLDHAKVVDAPLPSLYSRSSQIMSCTAAGMTSWHTNEVPQDVYK